MFKIVAKPGLFLLFAGFLNSFAIADDFPTVQLEKGGRKILIVGSAHLGEKLPVVRKDLSKLIKGSDGVCFESDPAGTEAANQVATELAFSKKDRSLSQRIGSDLIDILSKRLAKFKLDKAAMESLTPFVIAGLIPRTIPELDSVYSKLSLENSPDVALGLIAQRAKKRFFGLETKDQFMESVDSITDDEWRKYILLLLATVDCQVCRAKYIENSIAATHLDSNPNHNFNKMSEAVSWNANLQQLHYKLLFTHRNPIFAQSIDTIAFKEKKCNVVIIGAAHLGGHDGIINILLRSGYRQTASSAPPYN